jgi:hypothetical protein
MVVEEEKEKKNSNKKNFNKKELKKNLISTNDPHLESSPISTPKLSKRDKEKKEIMIEKQNLPCSLTSIQQLCWSNINSSLTLLSLPPLVSLPVYIPELQGLSIISVSCGIRYIALLNDIGTLYLWDTETRKLFQQCNLYLPGQSLDDWKQKLYTEQYWKSIQQRANKLNETIQNHPNQNIPMRNLHSRNKSISRERASTSASASASDRPSSGNNAHPIVNIDRPNTPDTNKKTHMKRKKDPQIDETKLKSNPEQFDIERSQMFCHQKENERLSWLQKDISISGKIIQKVCIGGSNTLSELKEKDKDILLDYEWLLVLTTDGCVYSAMLSNPNENMKKKDSSLNSILGIGDVQKETEKEKKNIKQKQETTNGVAVSASTSTSAGTTNGPTNGQQIDTK